MTKIFLKLLLQLLLPLMLSSLVMHGVSAEVKAYLNKSSFFAGDPVTLNIETDKNDNAKPDLIPLQKDFTIIGSSANSRIRVLNGKRSFKKSWTIELQPKSKGSLQIPSITVGQFKTEPLELSIADLPPEVTAETSKHIFIESSIGVSGDISFVQQQLPYTIKLFYDASMQTAQIQTPELKSAIIEKLGSDKRYEEVRAGKRYNVVEKNFVISPEKSGVLHIPAATVTGRIALSGGDSPTLRKRMDETDMLNNFFNDFRNDPFFKDTFGGGFFSNRSRGPSRPFSLSSEKIDVEVMPVPDAFTGSAWLPAEDLVIKDSWATSPPSLKVGEPVTRSLTLQAKGLAGSQIPDISFPKPEHIKSYPDKAKSETRTDGNTVYGIQHTEISYIPDVSGKVTIPRIMIDWWDVKNKKQRTFTLPEWNLNVAPDLNYRPDEEATVAVDTNKTTLENTSVNTIDDNPNLLSDIQEKYWGWKVIIAISLLLLLSILFIYRFKTLAKRNHTLEQAVTTKSHVKNKTQNISVLRSALLQACKNNDKHSVAPKLINYTQAYWADDSIHSLGNLASHLVTGSETIKALEKSLYSVDAEKWDARALVKLIEDGLQKKHSIKANDSNGLTPLYPA